MANVITFVIDGGFGAVTQGLDAAGIAVLQAEGDVLAGIAEKRKAFTRANRTGIGAAVRNTVLCVTSSLARLPFLVEIYEAIRARWSESSMDILVWADEAAGGKAAEYIGAAAGVFGLGIFYIRGDELMADDIRGICANLLENRLNPQNRLGLQDGFYLLCASVGSMGEFSLFYELSARRLQDAGKKSALAASADDVREQFAKRFVGERFKPIGKDAFRYLLWECGFDHGRGFVPSGQYRDGQPFAENVRAFIEINCSKRFRQDLDTMRENEGELYELFFKEFAPGFDDFLGEARITAMVEALELLRRAKALAQKERDGVLADAGRKPYDRDLEDLWQYSDYMYLNYFSRKIEQERFMCEQRLIESIYAEIDKAAAIEKENLEQFYEDLRRRRDSSDTFAQNMYDVIGELFTANPDAERFLLKNIRHYVRTLTIIEDGSSVSRALCAQSAAKFQSVLSNRINVAFEYDTQNGLKADFTKAAQRLMAKPQLLLDGMSLDSARHTLNLGDRNMVSVKPFTGYSSAEARALENDENAIIVYEYYAVSVRDDATMKALCKLI